jgi:hypothetical protein
MSEGGEGEAPLLTKPFTELVQSRVARDPDFAAALLREGIDTIQTGDVDTGKGNILNQSDPPCSIASA